MSLKVERLSNDIKKHISQILQFEVKDNKIGFVTVTDVHITNDLSIATVYVNFLGSDNREEAGLKALNRSKSFIRSSLAKKLTIRKVPTINFKIDDSLVEGNKVEAILRKIKTEDKK